MNPPEQYHARVSFVKKLAGDYHIGRFELVASEIIPFIAGQYVIFNLPPPKLRHTMSIASPPGDGRAIEILQNSAPMGEGSKWFLSLHPGDPVSFAGPLGRFVCQKETGSPKVFVATGSGIAPIRAMIGEQLSAISHQTSDSLKADDGQLMTLYWGLRFETDLFWQDEFEKFAKEHNNFQYFVTLSKPTDRWQGMRGRVTDHVVAGTKNLLDSEFYLCGNREMIMEMRKQLTDAGVPSDQIFTEAFF